MSSVTQDLRKIDWARYSVRAILACALVLLLASSSPAVLVLANQSTSTVSFELEIGSSDPQPQVLAAGQVLPLLTDKRVRIHYLSGKESLSESLEHRAMYYFLVANGRPLLHEVAIDAIAEQRRRPIVRADRSRGRPIEPGNTIDVKILVDQYHPARRGKESQLKKRIERAADFMEDYSGVRFNVVGQGTWSGSRRGTYARRQTTLAADTLDESADLVLGFETPIAVDRTGRPKGHEERLFLGEIRYDDQLQPVADPFARAILVGGHDARLSETHRLQQVIVALASYLGAVESPQFGSALHATSPQQAIAARKPSSAFLDPPNALVVGLVGQGVVRRGARQLAALDGQSRNSVAALRQLSRHTAAATELSDRNRKRRKTVDDVLYDAAYADGTVVLGASLEDWDAKTHKLRDIRYARLEGRRLLDPTQPVVWLRHQGATIGPPSAGFVEFRCGDRLPGESLEFRSGVGVFPDHLVVDVGPLVTRFGNARQRINGVPRFPRANPDDPVMIDARSNPIRVRTRWLRRIVRGKPTLAQYEPSTLITTDGRRIEYRSLIPRGKSLRVLAKGGIVEVAMDNVHELHFPDVDQWQAYYEQLAVLAPNNDTTLVQCETEWGLRATTAAVDVQRRMAPYGDAGSKRLPHESYFPAWSLDELWIVAEQIGQRRFFRPTEVPLSLFLPTNEQRTSVLATGLPWQLNRNVQGGPLASGGLEFAYGFGVQATSRLEFLLPKCVVGFRAWVGLDSRVGSGGCVRAVVHADSVRREPLYSSGVLIGSSNVVDTGNVSLLTGGKTPWRLKLIADASPERRPAGADPWDVRDRVNWLEPRLLLDPAQLEQQVARFREDGIRTASK